MSNSKKNTKDGDKELNEHLNSIRQNMSQNNSSDSNEQSKNNDQMVSQHLEFLRDKMKSNYKQKLKNEKMLMLDKLIEKVPTLKQSRTQLIQELVIEPTSSEDEPNKNTEVILEQFQHNGTNYYRDGNRGIWNEKGFRIGNITVSGDGTEAIYLFSDELVDDELKTLIEQG